MTCLYLFGSRIGIHNSLLKIILFFAAYTGVSSLFQIYMISQKLPELDENGKPTVSPTKVD
jgi:hypothetical protein